MEGKCASGGRLDAAEALAMAESMVNGNDVNRQLANNSDKNSSEKVKEGKIIYRLTNNQ
jgi:hypothetical protein